MAVKNFLTKYKTPLIAGGVIVAGTIGYFGFKKLLKKGKSRADVKNFPKSTVTTPSGQSINLIETARQLGIDLGTAYSGWNPRSWTENDDAALATLQSVPKSLIPQLMLEYLKLYNRNLQADAQEYLDDYDKIKDKFI